MAEVLAQLNPGIALIAGALLFPLLPHVLRGAWAVVLPLLVGWHVFTLNAGDAGSLTLFGQQLTTLRVDDLSRIFGLAFSLAALLVNVYALHLKSPLEATAGTLYAGSALGAVFAGDFITLFTFWEISAITSVFLIWSSGGERAYATGMRYLIIQVMSGVILLAGVMVHLNATGSIDFKAFQAVTWETWHTVPLATWLILLAFAIKGAFPLLHTWLVDAYPEATPTGTVMLSAFTTKLAVYALARGFPGSDVLIAVGTVMAIFTLIYAVAEDDLRRVIAYAIINQIGFMVIAVGVGTPFAIGAAAAQASASILYKLLLLMALGAVLLHTGTARASQLGGLARTMPWTAALCCIGALAISAPLFVGFLAKSLIFATVAKAGYAGVWAVLLLASAGVFLVAGIKVTYAAFFARPNTPGLDTRPANTPPNMLAAMMLTALACVGIGVSPSAFFALLPGDVTYEAFKLENVITKVQLLAFAALAFAIAWQRGWLTLSAPGRLLDTDWLYRRLGRDAVDAFYRGAGSAYTAFAGAIRDLGRHAGRILAAVHQPETTLGGTTPTGAMAFWTTAVLAVLLVAFYV